MRGMSTNLVPESCCIQGITMVFWQLVRRLITCLEIYYGCLKTILVTEWEKYRNAGIHPYTRSLLRSELDFKTNKLAE